MLAYLLVYAEDHPQPSKKSKKSHAGQSNVDDGKQTNNPKQKTVVKAEAMEEDDKKIKKQDEGKQAKSASDIKRPRKKERGQTETETKPIIKTVYTQALSRLQGQMKRMRQEQALVEAYAADGWRGASREKVKPVAEIRRAKEQINRCKEVIRDCVRVCDEAEGDKKIPAELYDEDGELELDDIFCAKCLENHASDDNDIILCDGDCDRAYHVKCLNPPLDVSALSEDEGWLCPACDTKIDLIDLINEEFGTEYEYNVPWHQILVADTLPPSPRLAANQGGVTIPQTIDLGRLEGLLEGADLPSEDDEDEDYKMSSSGESESQNSGKKGKLNDMEGDIEGGKREDGGDSKDSVSLVSEDGPNEPSDADDDMRAFAERYAKLKELDDGAMERHGAHLIVNGKRQRSKVDYVALSKDMFGNLPSPSLNEDEEDKEWIPKFIGNRNQQTDQN